MKLFSKFDKIIFSLNLFFIFLMTKLHLNAYFSFSIFLLIYLLHISFLPKRIMLYPFLFFPLMFILKGPDSSNLLLISFPEVLTLISIFYCFINKYKSLPSIIRTKLFYLIVLHMFLTLFITFLHILDISFLFIIIRQYTIPILFLLSIIIYSKNNEIFLHETLAISIFTFSIVALFAIFNLLNIINFVSDLPELQPILRISLDPGANSIERNSILMIALPRLNLLSGGALGSSAAVFLLLALIIFIDKTSYYNTLLKKYVIFILSVSALLTSSVSIITPLIVLFLLYFIFIFKTVNKILLMLFSLIIVLVAYMIYEFNPYDYFVNVFLLGYINFFTSLNLQDILFGNGPRITTQGYTYMNEDKFLIDVGIVRVFVETGIINFFIFITIILTLIQKSYIILKYNFSYDSFKFIVIFITFCLLVHANFSLLPPFYPLFAISVAGIILNYNKIKYNYVKG